METAGEGGAWGIAVLAEYLVDGNGASLEDYLNNRVFAKSKKTVVEPDEKDAQGFAEYMKLYKKGLAVQKSAYQNI